jgi:hypothetical protein
MTSMEDGGGDAEMINSKRQIPEGRAWFYTLFIPN